MLQQLRNRIERGLAFLHTTAHQPATLKVNAFVKFDECLIDMTRWIVREMISEVLLILELVVTIVPVTFEHFKEVGGRSVQKGTMLNE